MKLDDQIANLKGFGPKTAENFLKLGIETIEDLLCYYPFRYEDFQRRSVAELVDGEKALVLGTVVTPAVVQYYGFKRNRLAFKIKQDEHVLAVNFFNQPYWQDKIQLGQEVAVFGKWDSKKASLTGIKVLAQVSDELQPVYHLVKGISQTSLVKAIKSALDMGYLELLPENLPQYLLDKYRLLDRQTAVLAMHFPTDLTYYKQALRRLKFEEFFYFQLKLQILKASHQVENSGTVLAYDERRLAERLSNLPFTLTSAQERSLSEILADMKSNKHMNRLLQGDVGSGKTIIASLAMYAAHTAGYQSALMVPTEILAEQHYMTLSDLFPDLTIALLTSGMKAAARRTVLAGIAEGSIDLVVGTHALIQEGVSYHRLGLVITDEQHRFGVKQRRLFREKGVNPDVLMMTATPIPRTLAITAFGDMDVSIIDQLPAGRKPIITRWVKHEQLAQVWDWLLEEVAKQSQIYIISPLIEESEVLDLKNAETLHQELVALFGEKARVALMHGRMKSDDKEQIMTAFKNHELDILVSTTVIEVGVNVPNASIMIIMDADRFGLSQLHQLRGRVGRGNKQSYAILVANPKTDTGKERMRIMCETTDGFVLAEADLKMRGSGDVFGTKQSGIPEFKLADLVQDYPILEEARKVTQAIVSEANWQDNPRYAPIRPYLVVEKEFD
ncbi:ATP-dependent DNA helicase RecG [Streptococcus sp. sy010]|uniref:ATP-dependent DNA helicase RecG n=1 Tax=Streptococcus sp. sy010 TaxID=2600148 RepID=UPI0011B67757|nr:ATP-dependent DNA helicase RecG [Streptococcus sp. sy010]TWT14630.1 ATP-dependent DNA helicase RecG [Streptococcus sp. sy010]